MRRHSDLHQSAAISAVLLVLLFALPLAVVVPFQTELFSDDPIAVESEREPFQPGDLDGEMVLKVLAGDAVEEMTLGEYLVGVVRAEMPASFEPEALKAQAVAARTYTLYKMQTGGNHGDTADICTDSTCCQAYISEENARNNWGENADAYEEKIETAVRETDGETILYGGVPILAVFHSCSAGQTRSSGQVWVSDLLSRRCLRRSLRTASPTITAVWNSRRRSSGRRSWPPIRRRTCPATSAAGCKTP